MPIPKTFSGKVSFYYTIGLILTIPTIIFTPFVYIIYVVIGFPSWAWVVTKGVSNKFVLCFIAWFSDKMMPIQLIDYEGDLTNSMAFQLSDNTWYSWVYWDSQSGEICLLENGKIDQKTSEVHYIHWWRPLRESDLIQQKLTYDVPDFDMLVSLPKYKRKNLLKKSPYCDYK